MFLILSMSNSSENSALAVFKMSLFTVSTFSVIACFLFSLLLPFPFHGPFSTQQSEQSLQNVSLPLKAPHLTLSIKAQVLTSVYQALDDLSPSMPHTLAHDFIYLYFPHCSHHPRYSHILAVFQTCQALSCLRAFAVDALDAWNIFPLDVHPRTYVCPCCLQILHLKAPLT